MFVFSMANHEKSKKHKENLAALKLILQEETEGTQSLSDSDGFCSADDFATKCDRLSDTCSDTVDGHGSTGDNRELPVSDTTQQLPSNTSNDRLQDDSSVVSIDKEDNDSIISEDEEDDILLLLAKNKTKQTAEKFSGYHEDHCELVSKTTATAKPEENTTQEERYNSYCKIVLE